MYNPGNTNPSATERRLKPIYDCLDNGSNRKAVQEADRLLKKIKDLNCAKALKSLALLRLSKDQAANEILDEISAQQPLDEITLQTMTVCYRESGQFDKIVEIYDAAHRNDPSNEELLAHLFMAYVRTGNFTKQTETARSLYKHHPKRPYYFWAIMSLVMQAREASIKASCQSSDATTQERMEKSAKVCLQIAETMCKKMINEEKNHEEVEIEIYLLILHKLEKYEEEYRVMTGPLCQRNYDHLGQLARRRAYLCLDLKMYSRALKHYFPSLIQEYPDQLEYYQNLFKCALILDTEQHQPSNSDNASPLASAVKSTSSLCDCFDMVEKQCLLSLDGGPDSSCGTQPTKPKTPLSKQQVLSRSSSHQNKRLIRGPFIARIELYNLIKVQEDKLPSNVMLQLTNMYMSKYPSIRMLLADYFQLFSRKITCYYDMEYMISKCQLPQNEISTLLSEIGTIVAERPQNDSNEFDNFYTRLNYEILRHSFHNYSPTDVREDRVNVLRKCLHTYDHHLHLGSQFTKTEFLPVDHYCLLGVNAMLTFAINARDAFDSYFFNNDDFMMLIVILNNAIANSGSNHQLKLVLIKLYNFIGAVQLSTQMLELLEIKHFQIDTLGHLLNPVLYHCGHFKASHENLNTCSRFYALSQRDCFDSLTTSYRQCRFSKIAEITSVKDRLGLSLNYKQCAILNMIIEIIECGSSSEMTNKICQSWRLFDRQHRIDGQHRWEKIRDNRDFRVLRSLHSSTAAHVQQIREEILPHDIAWIQLRYEMIRCASSCYAEVFDSAGPSNIAPSNSELDQYQSNNDVLLEAFGNLIQLQLQSAKERQQYRSKPPSHWSFYEPEVSPLLWTFITIDHHVSLIKSLIEYYFNCYHHCPSSGEESQLDTVDRLVNEHKARISSLSESIINEVEVCVRNATTLPAIKVAFCSITQAIETFSLAIMIVMAISPRPQHSVQAIHSVSAPKSVPSSKKANASVTTANTSSTKAPPANSSLGIEVPDNLFNKIHSQLASDLSSKFETRLTRLVSIIKSIDCKILVSSDTIETCFNELCEPIDKNDCDGGQDQSEKSNSNKSPSKSSASALAASSTVKSFNENFGPILDQQRFKTTLSKVRASVTESYAQSLREFEDVCKKKIKMLR